MLIKKKKKSKFNNTETSCSKSNPFRQNVRLKLYRNTRFYTIISVTQSLKTGNVPENPIRIIYYTCIIIMWRYPSTPLYFNNIRYPTMLVRRTKGKTPILSNVFSGRIVREEHKHRCTSHCMPYQQKTTVDRKHFHTLKGGCGEEWMAVQIVILKIAELIIVIIHWEYVLTTPLHLTQRNSTAKIILRG